MNSKDLSTSDNQESATDDESCSNPDTIATGAPELPAQHTFRVREVAELIDVDHKTLRKGIKDGDIKCIRLGRLQRIPRAEVLRLLGL